jgi:hypothetical protein
MSGGSSATLGLGTMMKKTLIPFPALSVAAPSAFLLVYQTYAWNETIATATLTAGVLLAVALLAWSCLNLYRRRSRGFVGLLASAYCFWQLLVIPGFIHAVAGGEIGWRWHCMTREH